MEIDSVAAGGALKPDGDRFRRDEEPHFLIDVKKKTLVRRNDVRNIAIVAHVDHGKTTLVDSMLRQAKARSKFSVGARALQRLREVSVQEFRAQHRRLAACLAGVSLLCVSHNLRKHEIQNFLFIDLLSGRMGRLKAQYIQQTRQFTTLFQTTAYSGRITYINGGLCGGPSCCDYFMSARSNEDIS
ncbi:hypothetical protein F2Q69_00008608 [Brassica cretica]|uniref:Tr-type G domain-containing protein n=1 Tax=Brassica cretica TaxID=69181 RepID=A0A8S9NWL1_BRACR|nr:hypothetical protein F2Q69_00008608 [Brassica cretica]